MGTDFSQRFRRRPLWGLHHPPRDDALARAIESRWRWLVLPALCATVPAFYAELLGDEGSSWASAAYAAAAVVLVAALVHVALRCREPRAHVRANPTDVVLACGLLVAAALPPSSAAALWLWLRLAVALLTLPRMVWVLRPMLARGSVPHLLLMAAFVLVLCGMGYWWLEPTTPTLGKGLWLAFVTAATVGYGDVVPTTTASKIFSIFVVLLGFGVLSVVMAAIAAHWVESEERDIEREILRDMHRQMDALRLELSALRDDIARSQDPKHR